MAHGPSTILGQLTSDRQDLGHLLGGELAGRSWTRQVRQELLHGAAQSVEPLAAFDKDQAVEGVGPAPPPQAGGVPLAAQDLGNGLVVASVESKEDHAGALGDRLGAGAGARKGLEDFLLPLADNDLGCLPWHGVFSVKSG
jgi:hypothetical protein